VMAGILYARQRVREDAALRLTQDEVRRLAGMAERERIGRDLHDLLGHTLSVVALKSELAGKLVDRDPIAAKAQMREVEQVARDALSQVREAVSGIRASGLEAELALARLALLAAEVRLDAQLAPLALDPATEQALALVLREAVTNVVRHAHARRLEVELTEDAGMLRLSIADDGRGGAGGTGHGLTGMRERVAALGGALELDSPHGGGTRLLLRIPRGASGAAA
jgi:two-component system sensor histidine kinase DesK